MKPLDMTLPEFVGMLHEQRSIENQNNLQFRTFSNKIVYRIMEIKAKPSDISELTMREYTKDLVMEWSGIGDQSGDIIMDAVLTYTREELSDLRKAVW